MIAVVLAFILATPIPDAASAVIPPAERPDPAVIVDRTARQPQQAAEQPERDAERSNQGTSHSHSGPPSGSVWHALAECESDGRWHINTGNGFYGGLQFHPDTWSAYAPDGYPAYAHQATPQQQIAVAKKVQAAQGWGAWPRCSRKLGLR